MGGMIFGIGMALMEETLPDLRSGRLAIKDLADYHFPVNADVPQLNVIMVEEQDVEVNVIGTKRIGEIGIVEAAAAISCCNDNVKKPLMDERLHFENIEKIFNVREPKR